MRDLNDYDCDNALDDLQRSLDGEFLLPDARRASHLRCCTDCRGRYAAARAVLAAYPPVAPAGLSEHVSLVVIADRRQRQFRFYAATATSLAAALLMAVWWAGSSPPRGVDVAKDAPSLERRLGEATSTVLAMTGRAVEGLPVPELPAIELSGPDALGDVLGPAAAGFADARRGIEEGLEPVTSSAKRAASRLLQDLPF